MGSGVRPRTVVWRSPGATNPNARQLASITDREDDARRSDVQGLGLNCFRFPGIV